MAGTEAPEAHGLPAHVSGSLASVWRHYAGERPSEVDTVISGTRVACVIKNAVRDFDEGIAAAAAAEDDAEDRRLSQWTYRNDAIAAISRATGRRVTAFVSKHDPKTNVATEVFRLDLPPRPLQSKENGLSDR